MTKVVVSNLTHSPDVLRLVAEGFNTMMQSKVMRPDWMQLQSEDTIHAAISGDGDVIGVAVVRYKLSGAELLMAYVEPSSRRFGVFTELYKSVMNDIAREHVTHMTMTVDNTNEAMMTALKKIPNVPISTTYMLAVGRK